MRLVNVHLKGFRNHADTNLELGDCTNIILGDNGQGKTNIVEAISYLCLTKSFYASNDFVVLRLGSDSFEVEGQVITDGGVESSLSIAYVSTSREKFYSINRRRIEPLSAVVGRFPIVILSPEHAAITFGPPSARRGFVDLLMSQSSAMYLQDLLEYRRILKQRNKTLLDARLAKSDPGPLLEPWSEQLVEVGAGLMHRRGQFVEQFRSYITSSYHELVGSAEEPAIEYVPAVDAVRPHGEREITLLTRQEFAEDLRKEVEEKRRDEFRFGTTLVGPHRDEFSMKINGLDLRKFASQGQHKTFLIALKAGEFFFLKDRRRETPLFLLDDVFSELDEHRAKRLLQFLGGLSQTLVTSTNGDIFEATTTFDGHNRKFHVSNGTVAYASV